MDEQRVVPDMLQAPCELLERHSVKRIIRAVDNDGYEVRTVLA